MSRRAREKWKKRCEEAALAPIHPVADLFPLLEGDEFDELVEDIRANGQRDPISIVEMNNGDEVIIDGRNRLAACKILGIAPDFDCPLIDEDEIVPFILSKNFYRRHLTTGQRAMMLAQIYPDGGGAGRGKVDPAKQFSENGKLIPRIAEARAVLKEKPELAAKVKSGEVKLSVAHKATKPKKVKLTEAYENELAAIREMNAGFEEEPEAEKPFPFVGRHGEELTDEQKAIVMAPKSPKVRKILEEQQAHHRKAARDACEEFKLHLGYLMKRCDGGQEEGIGLIISVMKKFDLDEHVYEALKAEFAEEKAA